MTLDLLAQGAATIAGSAPIIKKSRANQMTISDFLLSNYFDRLEDIANHGISGGTVSELIWHNDIDDFYNEHKEEIDALVEDIFYDLYVGQPEEWFKMAKRIGYDIINIDDARRFYVALTVEITAQNLINQN